MRRKKQFVCLFVVLLLLAGCGGAKTGGGGGETVVTTSYKALATLQVTYDTTMKAAADLDKQGKLSADDKAAIIKYGNQFRDAYLLAVSALQAGESADINAASAAMSSLVALVGKYTGGK